MCGGRVRTARAQAECREASSNDAQDSPAVGISIRSGKRSGMRGKVQSFESDLTIVWLVSPELMSVQDNRETGLAAEDRFERDLKGRGYRTERNVWICDPATSMCSFVDIVARKGNRWVFVEVKTGGSRFTPNQVAVMLAINRGTAIPHSSKSESIGVRNDFSLKNQGITPEYLSVTEP